MNEEMIAAMEAMGIKEVAMHRIWTLAIEYHAKTITPERFAQRTYEILFDCDQELRKPNGAGTTSRRQEGK